MNKIGNQQMLRELNKSTLLNSLFFNGPISRVDLSRQTKLSPTTVSVLIEELIQEGIVHEIGTTGTGVGRKMMMLAINAQGGYVIGLDLSTSPARCVLLNLNGEFITSQGLKPLTGEQQLRYELPEHISDFMEKQEIPRHLVKRIGISIPGRLDDVQRVILASSYLKVREFPLLSYLEEAMSIPVLLTNDLDAAGFAERFSGSAKGDHTTIFIVIERGTGAGLVLNNQIYHGSRGTAGRIQSFDSLCIHPFSDQLKKDFPDIFSELSPEETISNFVELALERTAPFDHMAERIIGIIADYCGKMLQMLNPQKLILGGWITNNGLFFEKLVQAIHRSENSPHGPTPVVASHWKKYGSAMGAATLGLHEIFKKISVH
ncbi:DNA-binding transcriptional regulator NagC [Paenibacillus sp. JCM 10914]|uniref:ROK family transcriptional regulator n=1 Tax=Paenibacillus sp. JCM 10914 TaxID=1236974 RepID=UPI0005690064|nr:ROK family transcriptional regulator [Paenibacillus sp. JCM 10914]